MREDITDKKNKEAQSGRTDPAQMMSVASCFLLCCFLMGCTGSPATSNTGSSSAGNDSPSPRLLVFSKTTGFRHASIEDGIVAIRTMATEHHVVDTTEYSTVFTVTSQDALRLEAGEEWLFLLLGLRWVILFIHSHDLTIG